MLRKFFLITFIFLLSIVSFSENKLNFILNVDRGYLEYTDLETQVKYGLNFSGGQAGLNLDEGKYKFQFFSPDYHTKELFVTSDGSFRSYRVDLQKKESDFFISVIESRKQEVYISDKPVNIGKFLEGGELIFYQSGEPVKSVEINSMLEPVKLEHGYYDISLLAKGKTIFRVQRFPINENGGKFINFFASITQVNVRGMLKVGNMSLGGAEITFTDVDNNSYTMTSNFSGSFDGYLPARKYRVKVDRFGYQLKDEVDLIYNFTTNASPYDLNLELIEVPSVIAGRVFDDQYTPLEEAVVTMKSGDITYETLTDNYGRFRGETPAGLVFIRVEKDGFFHHGVVQKVEKSSTVSNLEIKIARRLFSIRGIMSDGVSPVKRKRIDLVDTDGRRFDSTLSGDNGYFEFLDIPATMEFYIISSVEGHADYSSEPFSLEGNMAGFNIILEPIGSKVVLQILDSATNTPIGNTSISVNGINIETDNNGMVYTEPSDIPVTVSVKGQVQTLGLIEGQEIYEVVF